MKAATKKYPKVYKVTMNVGKVKYLVSYHDGLKKYSDGSPFFDVQTFKNKTQLSTFVKGLDKKGYKEMNAFNFYF
jgi:hypothetical protein